MLYPMACIFYKKLLIAVFLLGILLSSASVRAENPLETRKNIKKLLASSTGPSEDKANAVRTLIALDRLQGNDQEAIALFVDHSVLLKDFLPKADWLLLRKWGCGIKSILDVCKNTKAQ